MPGIILRTTALKIVNKGGGYKTRMAKDIVKNAMGREMVYRHQEVTKERQKGTDYIVFNCPGPDCGKRNKKSMYEAKALTASGELSFKCYSCHREIEVARPKPMLDEKAKAIIVPDIQKPTFSGLYGPNNQPIQR